MAITFSTLTTQRASAKPAHPINRPQRRPLLAAPLPIDDALKRQRLLAITRAICKTIIIVSVCRSVNYYCRYCHEITDVLNFLFYGHMAIKYPWRKDRWTTTEWGRVSVKVHIMGLPWLQDPCQVPSLPVHHCLPGWPPRGSCKSWQCQ